MAREAIRTWFFALVVARHEGRFLLVQERKHGRSWSLPGGRVEPGERFRDAAVRETLEEAGVPVVLEGVLRIEHSPRTDGTARCRAIFLARPEGDPTPKSEPDDESLGARWVTPEEAARLPLRGEDILETFRHVASGGMIHPLSVLTLEGAPWR